MFEYFLKITFGKYFDTKQKESARHQVTSRRGLPMPKYRSAAVSVTPFLVVTALGVNLSAKHIESVTHVEHGI